MVSASIWNRYHRDRLQNMSAWKTAGAVSSMAPEKKHRRRQPCLLQQLVRACLVVLTLATASSASAGLVFEPYSVGWGWPNERWMSIETENFIVHYPEGQELQARRVAALAEQAHRRITQDLNWVPRQPTHLVLSDDMDLANGWATPVPFNQNRLLMHAPDGIGSLENHDDWLRALVEHEYLHAVHLDKMRGLHEPLRRWFGRAPLFFPNLYQPKFIIEGLAIQFESDSDLKLGRAYSSYYNAQMRAQVAAGVRGLSELGLEVNRRWPPGDFYLYGAHFFRFLAEQYGDDAAARLIEQYSDNLIPFRLHTTARQALGVDFHQLWAHYQHWLKDEFQPLSDRAPEGHGLTGHGLGNWAPVARGASVYRFFSDGHGMPALMRYGPGGETETLFRTPYPGPIDVAADGRVLLAARRINRNNRFWGDLYLYDGRLRRVTRQERFLEARWLSDGQVLARRMVAGQASMWRLNLETGERKQLWQGEPGDILGRLAVHPDDDRIVAAFKPAGRRWQLARFDQAAGQWSLLTDTGDTHGDPAFSADGDDLLFTADYGGVYDIHRLDLNSGEVHRLTQVDTAAFTPAMPLSRRLYYQYLSEGGYDLYRIDRPMVRAPAAALASTQGRAAPPEVDASAPTPYRARGTLRPRWWLPELEITADSVNAGFTTGGNDALGRHQYGLTARLESRSRRVNGQFRYALDNRYQILLERQLSLSTVDSKRDDQVVRVQAEDSLTLLRSNLASALDDHLGVHAGVFYEREHELWRAQDLVEAASSQRRGLAGVALLYDTRSRYHHSISAASGRRVLFVVESNQIIPSDWSGAVLSLDWQEFLHLGRSQVLALRLTGVHADADASPARLGDPTTQEERLLGRDRYTLRGYPDGALAGRRLALGTVEWRLPLARVQRNWQLLPLGLRDVHGALFLESGRVAGTDNSDLNRRRYDALGAEVVVEAVFGYSMLLPVRIGVGHGLDGDIGETRAYLSVSGRF